MIDLTSSKTMPETASPPLSSALVMTFGRPVPTTGGGQRSYLLLEALAKLGPVTLICADAGQVKGIPEFAFDNPVKIVVLPRNELQASSIQPKAKRRTVIKLRNLINTYLPQRGLRHRPHFARALATALDNAAPDVIAYRYVEGLMVAEDVGRRNACRVVDVDDRPDHKALSTLAARLGRKNAPRLFQRMITRKLMPRLTSNLEKMDAVFFASEDDVLPLSGPVTSVLPNVAFHDLGPIQKQIAPYLLFVGTASYPPNRKGVDWFLRHCWPDIVARQSDARLRIVGGGNWSRLQKVHSGLQRVDFLGFVDDLSAEYQQATATICPIGQGAGTQIKLIESCAYATAAVTRPFSANGFGSAIKAQLLVAETAQAFSEACTALLRDPDAALARGSELRRLQQQSYTRAQFIDCACTTIRAAVESPFTPTTDTVFR